ncbi:MAG TPA: glycine zipper domain-containing protein [Candidatus Eisenbacteria bacterium]|jgi:hypothetical protein|nr:glycine zipper domain-containing protein [Candidatus Eisenbacteria bacterium]
MKTNRIFSIAVLSAFALQAAAWADVVEGRVARASSSGLAVVVYDPQGRPYPNQLNLKVDAYTRVNGAPSVSALRNGDPVSADVRQEENGQWRADVVTKFEDISVRPATQKPSPSLRDVLGNPVVKGALVGAATGALASSASGGKAGKGALIGAGVGALFGGVFGGSQSRSDDDSQNR